MNKNEYSITRRGKMSVHDSDYGERYLCIDNDFLTNDFQQLVEEAVDALPPADCIGSVTVTLSVECLGERYMHSKRVVRSVDIDPCPEVI